MPVDISDRRYSAISNGDKMVDIKASSPCGQIALAILKKNAERA